MPVDTPLSETAPEGLLYTCHGRQNAWSEADVRKYPQDGPRIIHNQTANYQRDIHNLSTAHTHSPTLANAISPRSLQELERHGLGGNPNPCLTHPIATSRRAAMKPTQNQPVLIRDELARWMSTADGCDCGNLQPPDAALPIGDTYRCHYQCADCGNTWTRDYPAVV